MIISGWCLVISFFKTQYVLFSFAGWISWNGRNEGMKKQKKTREAIKAQLYYYGSLQLSLEGRKLPRAKFAAFLTEIWIISLRFFFCTRKFHFFRRCSDCSFCLMSFEKLLFLMLSFYLLRFSVSRIFLFYC